jgi:glycosyltransferase involved in cell wall biosynthesis
MVDTLVEIDIVYRHRSDPNITSFRRGNVRISWTRVPLRESSLHVYQSAYSYCGKTDVPDLLLQAEPVVVLPREYTFEILDWFDHVFTLVDPLVDLDPKFRKYNHTAYGRGGMGDVAATPEERLALYPIEGRRNRVCMILGCKTSPVPGEIYSLREPIARWFHERSSIGMDVYGVPPFEDLPNYLGELPLDTNRAKMAEYRYAVCFENAHDPFWTAGMFSERLLHCIESRTVPVYYGCSTIERYVPTDCYVDYREFESFDRLSEYLDNMPPEVYAGYIDAMDTWYASADLGAYDVTDLYDRVSQLYADTTSTSLSELYGDADGWKPTDSDGLSTAIVIRGASAEMLQASRHRLQWQWGYLGDGDIDAANATVAALREGSHTARDHRTPGPPTVTRRASDPIRRVLFVGKLSTDEPMGGDGSYLTYHMVSSLLAMDGIELDLMDCADILHTTGAAAFSQQLLDKVRRDQPDLLVYCPIAPLFDVTLGSLRDITAETDTRTLLWAGASPALLDAEAQSWPLYVDYVVAPSRALSEAYGAAGHASSVIESRWAFDANSTVPLAVPRERRISLGGERNPPREHVAEGIKANALPLTCYGLGWPDGPLSFEAMVREHAGAAINLSVMSRRRPFEVAGAGGFVMSTELDELEGAFVTDENGADDAEIVIVRDIAEIVAKARFYLANDRERERIRLRGHERARQDHTWERRFREVIRQAGWSLPVA